MRFKICIAVLLALVTFGCIKKPVQAPVPGSINALDAWAFRLIADSGKSIHSVKTWQQCSVLNYPPTVDIDGAPELCDPKAGKFPDGYKPELNSAIDAWNVASQAGKAYHDGAGGDGAALTQSVNKLVLAISTLLNHIGGGH